MILFVDEYLFSRSEMCIQFAILLERALKCLGFPSRTVTGTAMYFDLGKEVFRWPHGWIRTGGEVVDGNVDSLGENPMVPASVQVRPYWGPVGSIPPDRRLREKLGGSLPTDADVDQIWWPDLKSYVDSELLAHRSTQSRS